MMAYGLLATDEPEPAEVIAGSARRDMLLVADHAGNRVPRALAGLGLPPEELARHIGWDIGIWGLGEVVAARLGATLVRQRYSRLVIDCNRSPDRADAVPEVSDGTVVPGNAGLSDEARAARLAAVHAPYHAAIAREMDARVAAGAKPLLVSLHSFTPVMKGVARPWKVGVLHAHDSAASYRLLALLRGEADPAPVGDNEPYAMDDIDYTAPRHAVGRGLDYLEIEVRQDLIGHAAGQRVWGERVAGWVEAVGGE